MKRLSSHSLALTWLVGVAGCGTHFAASSRATADVAKDGTDVDGQAQSDPALAQAFINGAFEASSLVGWEVLGYETGGLNLVPPQSLDDVVLLMPDANTTTARLTGQAQSIVPQALSGANLLRVPFEGDGCALVNTLGNEKAAAKIAQTVKIGAADVDPIDAKVHIRVIWAPTLAIAPHAPAEQPFAFWQLETLGAAPEVVATQTTLSDQADVLWQTDNPNILYTSWQSLDWALGPDSVNVGDTVRLTGLASGCAKGAHTGQMYVDNVATQTGGVALRVDGPSLARPNQSLSYTFSVANGATHDASDVTVGVTLPSDTTFFALASSQNATCSAPEVGHQGSITCHFKTLAATSVETVTLNVVNTASAGSTVTLGKAFVQAAGAPPLLAMRVDTAIASMGTLSDLQVYVTKASSEMTLGANGEPEHTLNVDIVNRGPQSVDDATIRAYLPDGLSPINWQCQALYGASCAGGATSTTGAAGNLDTNAALPLGGTLACTVKIVAHPTGEAHAALPFAVAAKPPSGVTDPYDYNSSAGVMIDLNLGYGASNGAACTQASDCNSLMCVDGFCCDASCDALCMACDNAGQLGQCTAVARGAPHGSRPSCSPFACVDGLCAQACQEQIDCAPGFYCTPAKTCEAANSQDANASLWRLQGAGCQAAGPHQISQSIVALGTLALWGLMRRRRSRRASWLGVVCATWGLMQTLGPFARAADPHINIDMLRPMAGVNDVAYVQAARLPVLNTLSAMAMVSFADSPLRLVSTQNARASTPIVGNQTALDIGLAVAMWQRAELSVVLPFIGQSLHAAPYV